MAPKSGEKVLRFGAVARFAHWSHTVTFLLLAFTGMLIYMDVLDFLAPLFGGMQGARLLHRIAAVGFIVLPILSLFANPAGFIEWMSHVFRWGTNDFAFFGAFAKEFFGAHVEVPPQGRFNAGEKVNSLLQLVGCTLLAISGLILWFPDGFSQGTQQLALIVHDLAFVLTFTAMIGHAYLALFHPKTNEAINGMLSGYVDAEFAKSHYPLWYQEIKGKMRG